MTYTDNTRVEVDGRLGRVICAANRPGMRNAVVRALGQRVDPADIAWPITDGEDQFGVFQRFAPRKGDLSSTEAAAYKGREWQAPKRAFITIESEGPNNRWGKRIAQHFGLVVEAGEPLVVGGFFVIAQENQAPLKGQGFRPPGMSFEALPIARPKSHVLDEWLQLGTNVWDAEAGTHKGAGYIRSKLPLVRDQFYNVALSYEDGRGGPGFLEFWLGIGPKRPMELQGRYQGPTGYADFGGPYPAYGAYVHPGQVDVATRIYGWREDVEP